jgi:hypothetical protein
MPWVMTAFRAESGLGPSQKAPVLGASVLYSLYSRLQSSSIACTTTSMSRSTTAPNPETGGGISPVRMTSMMRERSGEHSSMRPFWISSFQSSM